MTPKTPRRIRPWLLAMAAAVLVSAGYVFAMLNLPLPAPQTQLQVKTGALDTGTLALQWPSAKQTAIAAQGYGLLAAQGDDTPLPIASVAKIILALAVLQKKPLSAGETGPSITIAQRDVDLYNQAVAVNGSVVRVQVGETLSEYQALQGLLLPSGNNLAGTLAAWAFGSEQAYLDYANKMVADMGMKHTHLADASGFSPSTVSTARDLVIAGQAIYTRPPLPEIVAQRVATLPVAGEVFNVNTTLGSDGIDGIKTGNTEAAGGCLLFSATRNIGKTQIHVVAVMVGAPDLPAALKAAPGVADTSYANFTFLIPIKAGQTVGTMTTAWAAPQNIVARGDLTQVVWKGAQQQLTVDVQPELSGTVGKATLGSAHIELALEKPIAEPDIWWRLIHPQVLVPAFFTRGR